METQEYRLPDPTDIKLKMNIVFNPDLANIIFKYFEPSIRVERKDLYHQNIHAPVETKYYTQEKFNGKYFDTKNIINMEILGILKMVNPVNKFVSSLITSIKGSVILVGNASFMFANASSFKEIIGIWDTSSVENMQGMFSNALQFTGDIGNWDVSRVENMYAMFASASKFTGDIGNWDVSRVENMDAMFASARSFNKNIGRWNVANVKRMALMFSSATAFDQDIGCWDISNVFNVSDMFLGAMQFKGRIVNKNGVNKILYDRRKSRNL